jgi:hypothetical protein
LCLADLNERDLAQMVEGHGSVEQFVVRPRAVSALLAIETAVSEAALGVELGLGDALAHLVVSSVSMTEQYWSATGRSSPVENFS